MTLVFEALASSAVLIGLICKYTKHKVDKYYLKKQYPQTVTKIAGKGESVKLSTKSYEIIRILSAQYGPYDVKPWIEQNLDTDYLEFSVNDQILQCPPTPPETALIISWEIDYKS